MTALLGLAPGVSSGQWLNQMDPRIPRTPDGKPNLSAPVPRAPDGKPDLSGIWLVSDVKWAQNIAVDLKPGEVPFQAWAEALYKHNLANPQDEPDARCLPRGVPKINAVMLPFKIVQNTDLIVILYETFTLHRQIFVDGRAFPADPNPTWLGYSVGKWDGDVLQVDTIGFNGKTWLDFDGHPTTERLHVVERFRRHDFGHMSVQVVIDDPGAYTKPWQTIEQFELLPDTDILEFICNENEKSSAHYVGD